METGLKKKSGTEQMTIAGTEEGEILARLQERVEKAIATIQELRRERDSWKERAESAGNMEEECDRLRKERDEIRGRIESILANLEALEE
jgi:FtsZ-binding cell division protein ZapB